MPYIEEGLEPLIASVQKHELAGPLGFEPKIPGSAGQCPDPNQRCSTQTTGLNTDTRLRAHQNNGLLKAINVLPPKTEEAIINTLIALKSDGREETTRTTISFKLRQIARNADLTDHNPNVFWELGVRQSYKQCTITIAETDTLIPFHFSHKGILFYNGEHLDNQEFEEKFLASLKNCMESPNDVDSPVLQALGGRGTLYSIIHAQENTRKILSLVAEVGSNEQDMNEVCECCERNKQLRSEKKGVEMSAYILRSSAIEALYVNRYVDSDEDFYRIVDEYYEHIRAINAGLAAWQTSNTRAQGIIEAWLIEDKPLLDDTIAHLKPYLTKLGKQHTTDDHL